MKLSNYLLVGAILEKIKTCGSKGIVEPRERTSLSKERAKDAGFGSVLRRDISGALKEDTDHEVYLHYFLQKFEKLGLHFELSRNINDTHQTAQKLLDYHREDMLVHGKHVFESFYYALSEVDNFSDLVEALTFYDGTYVFALNSLRAIYFNQIRQIELIQYIATKMIKAKLYGPNIPAIND
ncbi:hypothetical protein L0F63_000075 [Massospora cicadina]|nr:hypothetical protein L0F63_000075 [Massospora cicadina]